jgi:hypothetical protein
MEPPSLTCATFVVNIPTIVVFVKFSLMVMETSFFIRWNDKEIRAWVFIAKEAFHLRSNIGEKKNGGGRDDGQVGVQRSGRPACGC